MAKTNVRARDYRKDFESTRLAGGYGPYAARQDAEALLRRAVMACLLWEDLAYETGEQGAENIAALVPQVAPEKVAEIAIEARTAQKLRHVPLYIAREMARHDTHKKLVGDLLPAIIQRPDEITEFVAIYWKDGKRPLSKQVKRGLAQAFDNFDAYQFAKWNKDTQVKLRDVMFLVHPNPAQGKEELFKQVADDSLPVPDTWEVALSGGRDKNETWTRLIETGKLGALAFLRNLRNMEQAGVTHAVIQTGFETVNPRWLLPLNYLGAALAVPAWEREIETLMFRGLGQIPKLPGFTVFVVDVSGSMNTKLSGKSDFCRLDAARAMAMMAAEVCEHVAIYATAGDDRQRKHASEQLRPRRGFALCDEIKEAQMLLGGGGIFTRQVLEYIRANERETPDRIIVFSDSQDCDLPSSRTPSPFGRRNYIIDVSSHARGINYDGLWDAEISGWSEHFLTFIAALEGTGWQQVEPEHGRGRQFTASCRQVDRGCPQER
ncbi:MAG: TROVE domain-containing protein [Chloroflexota bacterium]